MDFPSADRQTYWLIKVVAMFRFLKLGNLQTWMVYCYAYHGDSDAHWDGLFGYGDYIRRYDWLLATVKLVVSGSPLDFLSCPIPNCRGAFGPHGAQLPQMCQYKMPLQLVDAFSGLSDTNRAGLASSISTTVL